MSITNQRGLAASFADLGKLPVNRSSAVFPVVVSPSQDTILVALNYWKIKNKNTDILIHLRIYDQDGALVKIETAQPKGDHLEFSMAHLLGSSTSFAGMVEFEVLGLKNMFIPFPAVQSFYRTVNAYSSVHSAGRVKNPDEACASYRSIETNWICRFGNGWTPAFHIFNGSRSNADDVMVEIRDQAGLILQKEPVKIPVKPFASRLVRLTDLFKTFDKRSAFVSVQRSGGDVFPRMVVGNVRLSDSYMEVTHSFQWITSDDYVSPAPTDDNTSHIELGRPKGYSAEFMTFPTTCPATLGASIRSQTDLRLEPTGGNVTITSGGNGASIFRFAVPAQSEAVALDLSGPRVPARLAASKRYRIAGSDADYATDIASGARACVYPPKRSHWGHGIMGGGFDTHVVTSNIAHRLSDRIDDTALLSVYDRNGLVTQAEVRLTSESIQSLKLPSDVSEPRPVSWFFQTKAPSVECLWLAGHSDGRICGDHAF